MKDCLQQKGRFLGYIENEQVYYDAEDILKDRINYLGSEEDIQVEPQYSIELIENQNTLTKYQVADKMLEYSDLSVEYAYGFYLNGENQTVTAPAGSEQVAYLGSMPYLCLSTDGETAGWLITSGRMTAGGTPSTAHLCLRYREVSEDDPNKMYLSFDQGETDFVPGDTLTAQVIRVETETVTEDALKILRNGGSFQLIQKAERNSEPFTVLGMEDSVILQIEGFDRYTFPKILANGEEFTPEYHVYVDKNGYYGFAFAVPAGTEIEIKK